MSVRHTHAGTVARAGAPLTRHPVSLRRKCACGGAAGPEGECEACGKKRLDRSAAGAEPATAIPAIVHQVLRTPGAPLDAATRAVMEPHFGHDFSRVRVHADMAAAESARAVRAAAYTVGHDLVFAAGKYAPGSRAGQQLVAHELAHVVQQESPARAPGVGALTIGGPGDAAEHEADRAARSLAPEGHSAAAPGARPRAASPPALQRAAWGQEYGPKDPARAAAAEAAMGDIQATTQTDRAGTPAANEIGKGILERIYPFLKADLDKGKVKPETVERYRTYLNRAFRVMKIDTVEAQANFLAHASEESGQLRAFTESQGESQHWAEDPNTVKLEPSKLPKDKDVNPKGHWEFIGRGAVQVTHEDKYVRVIAELERTAAQYRKDATTDPKAAEMAKQAQAAADAIKEDPRNAARPEYAFLASAAFMKMMEGDRKASQTPVGRRWSGKDSASGWVGGGEQAAGTPQFEALGRKTDAFKKIFCILLGEAQKAGKSVAPHKLKSCGS